MSYMMLSVQYQGIIEVVIVKLQQAYGHKPFSPRVSPTLSSLPIGHTSHKVLKVPHTQV